MKRPLIAIRNEVVAGAIAIMVLAVAVWISYNASRGIPFLSAYRIAVDVPDAQELVTSDPVRIGGANVGIVTKVSAMPGTHGRRPYAELDLQLSSSVAPLPVDTEAAVRVGSVLGGKYLALYPGRASRGIPEGGVIPMRGVRVQTDLGQAFHVFNAKVTRGIQGGINELGIATAGRGAGLNQAVGDIRALLPGLQRVLTVLVDPSTNLSGFLHGAAATVGALEPVTAQLTGVIENGTVTLRALNRVGPQLGKTIEALPRTESLGRSALVALRPIVDDASAVVTELQPSIAILPQTTSTLSRSLAVGTRALRDRTHGLLDPLIAAFGDLGANPATAGTVSSLEGTIGSVGATLRVLQDTQITCNTFGVFARNGASMLSEGDPAGTWLSFVPLFGTNQIFQSPQPDSDLHLNFYPHETSSECEAGNEPYSPGQAIGNPPGNQGTATDHTRPPKAAIRRAQAAGLWQPVPGGGG